MNNPQLQDAIRAAQELLCVKDAWPSAKDLALDHLKRLYDIQFKRAQIAHTPRITLKDIK